MPDIWGERSKKVSMMPRDYKVIDMPSMMARSAMRPPPDGEGDWIRDENWYSQIREIYLNLLEFLQQNNLLKRKAHTQIDDLVIMFSDLTEDGQELVRSGADDRWIASFDRPNSTKSPTDVGSLEKALSKVRS